MQPVELAADPIYKFKNNKYYQEGFSRFSLVDKAMHIMRDEKPPVI